MCPKKEPQQTIDDFILPFDRAHLNKTSFGWWRQGCERFNGLHEKAWQYLLRFFEHRGCSHLLRV